MYFQLKTKKNNIPFFTFLIIVIFCLLFLIGEQTQASVMYSPQTTDLAGSSITFDNSTKPLGEFIKKVYAYGVGITAILATVVLMIGGFQWIIAGGSGEKIGEAKAWITAALSGLVLALSSYMILELVNPNLVNFSIKSIKVIEEIKAPELVYSSGGGTNVMTTNLTTYDPLLKAAATKYGVDCNLLKAVMYSESSGIPREGPERNGEKAQGLMQMMPSTGKGIGFTKDDLQNNAKNLEAGAKYLRDMTAGGCNGSRIGKNKNGIVSLCNTANVRYVIAAYNGGPLRNSPSVDKGCESQTQWQCLGNPKLAETRKYVNTVLLNLNSINLNGWGCK